MKRTLLLLVAGVVLAGEGRVYTHHSFGATYDATQIVEIEGVVRELVWRNPHSFLRIDATDTNGAIKTWALEWASTTQLTGAKLTRTTLRPGDRVVVTGQLARDQSSPRALIMSMKRPADGWSWEGKVD